MRVYPDATAEPTRQTQSIRSVERARGVSAGAAGWHDPRERHDDVNAESTSGVDPVEHPAIEGPSTPIIDTNAQRITFYYHNDTANNVALAGTFNEWRPTILLKQEWRRIWKVEIPMLPSGTYQYKFVVDGRIWNHDPENLHRESDAFGGFNSVFTIP